MICCPLAVLKKRAIGNGLGSLKEEDDIVRILALAAVFAGSAALAAPEPRTPNGKWVVDFANAQCVASRNYGSGEAPLYLVLKAPALGDVLQIGIVRNGALSDPFEIDGMVSFDGGETVRGSLLEYGARNSGQRALLINLPAANLKPLRTAKTMRIHAGDPGRLRGSRSLDMAGRSHTDETFALLQMPELLKMLDTCVADLRDYWNVDDPKGGNPGLKQGASGDLSGLFSPDDYPGVAMVKSEMGTLKMVMLIDETGKVADCTVVETSGVASLDAQSCVIARQRGRFTPATGLDGKPAKSAYRQRITWRLE